MNTMVDGHDVIGWMSDDAGVFRCAREDLPIPGGG
jgi:hypothetical protein